MSEIIPIKNIKFLKGGGEMDELIRSKDWSKSSVGNFENWSPSLRTTLSIILNSKFPMFLFWGPDLLCFYNDAYRPSLGNDGKHPHILGKPARESWQETWHFIKPVIDGILAGAEATLNEDQLFTFNRNNHLENGYWTYCYSSVENESGEIVGVFVTCNETSKKVEALEKLEENEKKLNFMIDATNLGIWNFNPNTQIFKCNNRLKKWFGIDENKDIDVETAISRIIESDREKTRNAMIAAMKTGSDGNYEVEHTVVNPLTNQEYILRSKGKSLFDEDNKIIELSGTLQDITEQVLSRRKIEENEEELRFALDGGNLGYFNSYPLQNIINWSDKTKEFFGIAPDEKVDLEVYRNAIHPDDAARALTTLNQALNDGEDSLYINEYRTAHTNKWLNVKGKIKIDKDGQSVRITGIIQDITESKLAQKRLLESEHRFRNMIHTSPNLISILKGENFIIEIANDAILDTWGKGNDVVGKPLLEVVPELAEQGFGEILTQVYKTGVPYKAFDMPATLLKEGVEKLGYYTFIYQVQRDLNGEIESIAIIATEVTQQAELNQKIQENERLLRETKGQLELTFANVPASIFLYNNQKEILFANERAANMLGYNTVEELLSYKYYNILMKKGMQDFYVQNENNEFFGIETLPTSNALKSKMQGEMVFSMQNKLDGNKIWYLNKSAPILDTNGGVSMVLTTSTDITAQKLAEETIRDSENRFRLLSDNAPMWVWITDLDINVLYANHELLNYIGLNHYSEFTGKVWQQVVHPDDITIVNENFKKSIVEQTTFDFEVRILNAKTEQFEWFYLKGIPKYENEEFIGFIGTGINIHHQKIHLFALEESEQRFKYLVETLPQMVCVMDENGISEYVTNKWEKYTGIKPGEGLKTWVKIVHPDDLEYSNSIWLDSLKSGSIYKFDLRLKSKEGEYRWFSVNGEPVFDADDKIIKWVSAFTDIHTEKSFSQELEKQVSERTNELLISNELMLQKNDLLRISENFNRSLTDISPNIVYIQDILEDKPFFLNSTYLTFTGYNWQQVKALGDGFMREVIHPDDYDFISETIEKIKVSKVGEIFEAKSLIKNDKGIWVPFLNRLTAFKRDKDQNVIQVIGVAIDISELKGAEKILEQKNEELLKMNKELESFAYVSSHDLQEPLRKIQTFTSRIMEKEYDNLSETGQNYLNRMRLAAERMQQLINDLLAYSRTKVQERKFESTDLSLIVKEVEDDLRDDLAKKNGQIIIIDSYKADVIPFQFRQLMYNLVSNSIKFAKSDEDLNVKVKFEVIKGIESNNDKLIEEKEYCHISISDNGIGFDSSYKDKIFEIFQRLHGREEYTGTGIGLAIVKKIVDNHNGVITADGELGKGATFHIYIPI
ncbi:MAG: hypothetical protein RLZZ306_2101 [Bacteroidota bacterium]